MSAFVAKFVYFFSLCFRSIFVLTCVINDKIGLLSSYEFVISRFYESRSKDFGTVVDN